MMLYYYLPAATRLKALRTKTASELVGLVAETLEGLNVIQAFGKNEYFVATAAMRYATSGFMFGYVWGCCWEVKRREECKI